MSESTDTERTETTPATDGPQVETARLETNVIAALRTIYDPEIPVNIYDLGLVYGLDVDAAGKVDIRMTLTAPACPVAETFPGTVEQRLYEVPGVSEVRVELVWEPPWNPDRLSEDAKLSLGLL
ncbi:MAG TPA: SUF system Fe-S cluster assembly protein [Casimicrobiaceae bacterium]|nr:SUF system Fe-S cluster assembly protein [Casimicrobiaceae bacterium]